MINNENITKKKRYEYTYGEISPIVMSFLVAVWMSFGHPDLALFFMLIPLISLFILGLEMAGYIRPVFRKPSIILEKKGKDLLQLSCDKQKLKKTLYFPLNIEFWWNYVTSPDGSKEHNGNVLSYQLNLLITDIGGETVQVIEELGPNESCPTDCHYKVEDLNGEQPIYHTRSIRKLLDKLILLNGGLKKVEKLDLNKPPKLKQIKTIDIKKK